MNTYDIENTACNNRECQKLGELTYNDAICDASCGHCGEFQDFLNVGFIDISVTLPDGKIHLCQGVIEEDIVMFNGGDSGDKRPGITRVRLPEALKGFSTQDSDVDTDRGDIDEMISYAINEGHNSSSWDSGLKFKITTDYTRT
jgi:hypothetical protein